MPADRIFYCMDYDHLSRQSGMYIADLMNRAIQNNGRCTLVLSGGRTPKQLYRLLGNGSVNPAGLPIDWSVVNLFLADEHIVSPDYPESNFLMIRENLVNTIPHFTGTLNHPDITLQDPLQIADVYEQVMRSYFHPDAFWPKFDIIVLGLGTDGHTGSLFSDSTALNTQKRWVSEVHRKPADTDRITMTLPVINHARHVVFLVSGTDKSEVFRKVIEGDPALPASRVRPIDGTLTFFVSE
ncbi:6-phosphogluconolactonase [bacterium]|nr:6-phosphogluconolactonase [candidate division CSSED10-310 bacterium]